ncbi:hypothetical protein LAV82_23655 [Bacillus sp. ILBB4]|nr:hypothetical protein [Bacillus sp. ILBB4]
MTSEIMKLDTDGEFHSLATYSLDPEQALIAYYMQQEKRTYNTWNYPEKVEAIKERPMGLGFFYNKGEDVIYSRPTEEALAI